MSTSQARRARGLGRWSTLARGCVAALILAAPAFSEQKHVTRYDVFAGYAYLNSPAASLPENGVQFQIGVRPATWVSLGFDYTNARGELKLTPDMLLNSLRQQLGVQLGQLAAAGRLPAGYILTVPADSATQTFTVGPQLAFRRWSAITLFLRPSIGYMREVATPRPRDPIATAIVQQLASSGKKVDWTRYYGAGGGIDLNFTKNFSLRLQGDIVWDHLFPDLLQKGRRTYRIGVGPAINFGRNIVKGE